MLIFNGCRTTLNQTFYKKVSALYRYNQTSGTKPATLLKNKVRFVWQDISATEVGSEVLTSDSPLLAAFCINFYIHLPEADVRPIV